MEARPTISASFAVLFFALATTCVSSHALDEIFDLYTAPHALSMGNAYTADAMGYHALYYNPAGLARWTKKRPEIHILSLEGVTSMQAVSTMWDSQSMGMYRLFGSLKANPNSYNYFRFGSAPAFTTRGFGISLLGNYEYAAISDGTTIDINSHTDVGVAVGTAINLAGNILKLGVSGKVLVRNQLKGVYVHSAIPSTDARVAALMKEGLAFGSDIGIVLSYPFDWLPTLGVVWKDILDTRFQASNLLNADASDVPDAIPQSVNAGFSIHPKIGKRFATTLSADFRHIELSNLPLRKRLHFGVQLANEKSFYIWFGMNQLYFSGGIGTRLPGGNLELGTYSQDIGRGDTTEEDRRFLFRYTISFNG